MAGTQVSDLLARTVLVVPVAPALVPENGPRGGPSTTPSVSGQVAHPLPRGGPIPSPLEAVAAVLPSLSACTALRASELPVSPDVLSDARARPFPHLALDARPVFLSFTLHAPSFSESDSARFHVQSALFGMLGVVAAPEPGSGYALDVDETARRLAAHASAVLGKHALPTSPPPRPHLLIVVGGGGGGGPSSLSSSSTSTAAAGVHSTAREALQSGEAAEPGGGVRAAVAALAADMLRNLMDDARAAVAGTEPGVGGGGGDW